MKRPTCWYCASTKHYPNDCPQQAEVNAMSVDELKAKGFVCLEGGGFVHKDYLNRTVPVLQTKENHENRRNQTGNR